jgi:non-LEE-encoded effector NleA
MNDLPGADSLGDTASLEAVAERLQSPAVMNGLRTLVEQQTAPGTFLHQARDKSCFYNVNQCASELPLGFPGVTGKYGVQMNIVKPNDPNADADYYLQLFLVHDEIGLHTSSWLPPDTLPYSTHFRAQIVRNHGFNIPFRRTPEGMRFGGRNKGVEYMEEVLVRPFELGCTYFINATQVTLALETGVHFKWEISNPEWKTAAKSNIIANTMGAGIGVALSATSATMGTAIFGGHVCAMVGQLVNKGRQIFIGGDRPDEISAWAGTTTGLLDFNIPYGPVWTEQGFGNSGRTGRITNYARLATNGFTHTWRPNDPEQEPPAADTAELSVVSTISQTYESRV